MVNVIDGCIRSSLTRHRTPSIYYISTKKNVNTQLFGRRDRPRLVDGFPAPERCRLGVKRLESAAKAHESSAELYRNDFESDGSKTNAIVDGRKPIVAPLKRYGNESKPCGNGLLSCDNDSMSRDNDPMSCDNDSMSCDKIAHRCTR